MAYITEQSLWDRIGSAEVKRMLDDDGDGASDSGPLTAIISEAEAYADSLLTKAFPLLSIADLAGDHRLIGAVADIAIGLCGERRPEWAHPQTGAYPHAPRFKRGKETLQAIAMGAERLGAEATYGRNKTISGRTSQQLPAVHIFATSRTNPRGSGGF